MKKINLIFIGAPIYKYNTLIKIFDKCGNLIYEGITNNGKITLYLKTNEVYIVKSNFLSFNLTNIFYVKSSKSDYIFVFNNSIINNDYRTVTFLLTDYYYDNLKIEKGELILWQRQ